MIGSIYFKSPQGDGIYDSKNGDGSRLERRSPFSRCFGSVCTGFILAKSRQQTVEIAKALSVNAKIIVMDEPSAALTSREVEHLFAVIRDLKDARHRHHLHQPPPRRDLRRRRSRDRAPRRRARGHPRRSAISRARSSSR